MQIPCGLSDSNLTNFTAELLNFNQSAGGAEFGAKMMSFALK